MELRIPTASLYSKGAEIFNWILASAWNGFTIINLKDSWNGLKYKRSGVLK
jgi:hypothetical protein